MTGALCLSLLMLTACSTPQPMDLIKSVVDHERDARSESKIHRDRSTCTCSTSGAGYGCSCTPLPECGPSVDSDGY